jgi:sodium/potassium-transporting ATPase subunit alpha
VEGLNLALPLVETNVFKPDEQMLLTIKGAPDFLMDRCTHFTGKGGETCVLDDDIRRQIAEIKNQWSAEGRRVILLGRRVLSNQANNFTSATSSGQFEKGIIKQARAGLTLVGLVAIEDPPRDKIPEVIRVLRRAGIRIFMVCSPSSLTKQLINSKE